MLLRMGAQHMPFMAQSMSHRVRTPLRHPAVFLPRSTISRHHSLRVFSSSSKDEKSWSEIASEGSELVKYVGGVLTKVGL